MLVSNGADIDSSGSAACGPQTEEDPFDEFLSAAPVATAVPASDPCAEEKAFFGQTAERRNVLTKESILSLYSASQPPAFAAPAAGMSMQAVYTPGKQARPLGLYLHWRSRCARQNVHCRLPTLRRRCTLHTRKLTRSLLTGLFQIYG